MAETHFSVAGSHFSVAESWFSFQPLKGCFPWPKRVFHCQKGFFMAERWFSMAKSHRLSTMETHLSATEKWKRIFHGRMVVFHSQKPPTFDHGNPPFGN